MSRWKAFLISCLLIHTCYSQTDDFPGFFSFKLNSGYYFDSDANRFSKADPNYNAPYTHCPAASNTVVTQYYPVVPVFPGAEIDFYFAHTKTSGIHLGFAYSPGKTFFHYNSTERLSNNDKEFVLKTGTGNGSLTNHLCKFIYGFNFNNKKGFSFFLQPLNPELRIIRPNAAKIILNTYQGYYSSKREPQSCLPMDSTQTFVSSEEITYAFYNYRTRSNLSFSFPTTIGIEQRLKIGNLYYLAGISATISALERYYAAKLHFGICLGNFKSDVQPGY